MGRVTISKAGIRGSPASGPGEAVPPRHRCVRVGARDLERTRPHDLDPVWTQQRGLEQLHAPSGPDDLGAQLEPIESTGRSSS